MGRLILFHGEDTPKSRQALWQEIQKNEGRVYLWRQAKEVKIEELTKIFSAQNLFASPREEKIVVLENFSHLPLNQQEKILSLARRYNLTLFLWEEGRVESKKLSRLSKVVQIQTFNPPQVIYHLLNNLGIIPFNLAIYYLVSAYNQLGLNLLLYLLKQQLRRLLKLQAGGRLDLANWQKQKLVNLAKRLSVKVVKKAYLQLIRLEADFKSGKLTEPLFVLISWLEVFYDLKR